MPKIVRRTGRSAAAVLAAAVVALIVPAAASAAGTCEEPPGARVFAPWMDPALYVPAPDGGLENGGAGWLLDDGAAVQDGNEPFHVGGADDSRSLRLPAGSTASTPAMCIGLQHPTVRFFARNTGSPLSLLKVSVVFDGLDGDRHVLPIGLVTGGGEWAPSPPLLLGVNVLSLLAEQRAELRFEPVDTLLTRGRWSIDDVYVDPYKKG